MSEEKNCLEERTSVYKKIHGIIPIVILFLSVCNLILIAFLFISYNRMTENLNTRIASTIESNIKQQTDSMIRQIAETGKTSLNDKLDTYLSEVKKSSDAVVELAKSRIIQNEQMADEASRLAQENIADDNLELARVYLLNAVNHNPLKAEYISLLFQFIQKYHASSPEIINQARSVMELALFQLPPSDVVACTKYINELNDLYTKATSLTADNEDAVDWASELETAKKQDLNQLITRPENLAKRIEKLGEIISNLEDATLLEEARKELETSQNLYSLCIIASKIDNYLNLLENMDDYTSRTASSRLLAATSAMSVFWEYDLSLLPSSLSLKIEKEFPERLDKFEKEINRANSEPYYNEAVTALEKADSGYGTRQSRIKNIEEAADKALKLGTSIHDDEYNALLLEKIRDAQKKITKFKKEQYVEYQKWAAGICSGVFQEWSNTGIFTDSDAKRIFDRSNMYQIDSRLITPEINKVYNEILQKFTGELKAEDAFEYFEKRLMLSNKKELEDF